MTMKRKTRARSKATARKTVRRARSVSRAVTPKRAPKSARKTARKPATRPKAQSRVASDAPSPSIFPYEASRHGDFEWHLAQFGRFLNKLSEEDRDLLKRALEFAKDRHEKQIRKDGSPYIIHPVRIANIILHEWGIRQASIVAAALLHDVIEDTPTTIREVKDGFGDDVGKLVDGMTMWPGSETPEVYLKRVSRGPRELRIIKCADVLDNLRSWHECGADVADRFTRWWRQAHDFALPMAEETLEPAGRRIREIVENPWYLKRANMM